MIAKNNTLNENSTELVWNKMSLYLINKWMKRLNFHCNEILILVCYRYQRIKYVRTISKVKQYLTWIRILSKKLFFLFQTSIHALVEITVFVSIFKNHVKNRNKTIRKQKVDFNVIGDRLDISKNTARAFKNNTDT